MNNTLPLYNGASRTKESILVDPDLDPVLRSFRWYMSNGRIMTAYFKDGKFTRRSLGALVLGLSSSRWVSHLNGDPLDCRKENLVVKPYGVTRQGNRWKAQVHRDDGMNYLGLYATAEEASAAVEDFLKSREET